MEDIKNTVRAPRALSSRENESRVTQERPPIVFGGGSRFNLPASVLKKLSDNDEEGGFVVYSSGNVDQKENYFDALRRGWEPSTVDEYPELARQYAKSPFGDRDDDRLIKIGGQIHMKRKLEIKRAEDEYYDSENQRQEYMAEFHKFNDARYPTPFIDQRTRMRKAIR